MAGITPFLALLLLASTVAPALGTNYDVGDSQQWTLGVNYDNWVSGKTFKVGDNLVFKYTNNHDVAEVNQANYGSCSSNNVIAMHTDGDTTIALNTTGSRYFICTKGTHCSQGMKLQVTVSGSSSSPPSGSPSPPPPSSGGSPTSPPPPPPPPPNGAINTSSYKRSTLFFGVLLLCLALFG